MLRHLEAIGSSGVNIGNANRDLQAYAGEPNMPKEQVFDIPVRVLKVRRAPIAPIPMLRYTVQIMGLVFMLPHLWLNHMFTNCRDVFTDTVMSNSINPRQFWTEVASRRDPRLQHHPTLEKPGWMDRAIPLMVHGDGVPVTRVGQSGTKSLDTISWQSLFAAGVGVRNVKHLIFTIFEDNKAVPRADDESNTMRDVWEIVAWSFEAMFEGRFPDKDHK